MTSRIIHSGLLRTSPESPELRNASTILSRLSSIFFRCCDVSTTTGRTELVGRLVDVEAAEQLAHRGRADVGEERGVALLLRLRLERQELVLVEQLVVLDFLRRPCR